jgi:PilZ domain
MTVSDTRVRTGNPSSNAAIKRRTQRVHIAMPVCVSGGVGEAVFDELAETVTVSAHGCLVHLKGTVARLEELLIVNPATQQQVLGTVVFIKDEAAPKEIGIEFAVPSPLFWGITFPPVDWDPAERKLPSNASHQPSKPKR